MIKKFIAYCCFATLFTLIVPTQVEAQSKTFDDVYSAKLRNMGPIIKNKMVQGYYMFYKVDKVDRKNNEYLLQILDANLNVVGSKKIIDSKNIVLLEATYNGQSIMMKFFDRREKSVDYRNYDQNAELVYKKTRKLDRRWELALYNNAGTQEEITNTTLFPVLNNGFVEYATKKEKKMGYEIKYFPNSKEEKAWTKGSSSESKEHETATFIGANENIILSQITKQKSLFNTKSISYYLQARDTKTAKRIFNKELTDSRYELAVLNAYLKEDGSEEIAVLGQFYPKGSSTVKSKSLGLFSFVYDKEGKILHKNFAQWVKDIGEFVAVNDKGKIEDVGYVYFHEIVQTADGKIYAIGETFRRTASALGIASVALGGGGSVTKIVIEDIAIFEFSSTFELQGVQFFEKSKNHAELGDGGDFTRIMVLARMLDAYGWFDYSFTQRSSDNNEFLVGYVDYEKNKNTKNQLIFGAIARADGEYSIDKIPIKVGFWGAKQRIFPAKPGYVMFTEYNRKEKKLDMHLEKLNY